MPNKIAEEEMNQVIIIYSYPAFRLCAFSNRKIIIKAFFFSILLTAIQYNDWQTNDLNIVFLYYLRISGLWLQSQEKDLIIQSQTFKWEVHTKTCIFESCWHSAVACTAYHKHLSHIHPYIYTKAWCNLFSTLKTLYPPCLCNQGNILVSQPEEMWPNVWAENKL